MINNSQEKILSSTNRFDVIEREGKVGIRSTVESVMILPFINDDQGLPLMLGVLKEKNPFREGGYSIIQIFWRPQKESLKKNLDLMLPIILNGIF